MPLISTQIQRGISPLSLRPPMTGQLVTVVVGYDTRYFVVALVNALIPTIFILGLIWLPESPSFLVLKGKRIC